ncbi:hypothetical protein [Hymenobacter amundsenii]|uniref:hypothetical protein n=1 Tax=Hymenobacter amundsenii TaxID=2006685 RepID=UPI000F820022|nr:hypothetical protein [Hymenobacter amundsenii]
MEVVTKEEHEKMVQELAALRGEVQELREQIGITWIDQKAAEALTGRSPSWFYARRTDGTLPIAQMPRDHGSRRNKYSRADCVKYGREHGVLPPAGFQS